MTATGSHIDFGFAVRSTTQFKLVSDMEAQFDRMAAVVAKYA